MTIPGTGCMREDDCDRSPFFFIRKSMAMLYIQPIPFDPYEPISHYYRVGDMVCNRDAYNHRIMEQYVFDPIVMRSMKMLATSVLDILCDKVGDKIFIEKGYLCPRLATVHEGGGVIYRNGNGALLRPKNGQDYEIIWNTIKAMEFNLAVSYPRFVYVNVKETFNQRRAILHNYKY